MGIQKLYKNQSLDTVTNVNIDISTATKVEVMYKSPSGSIGSWPADIVSGSSVSHFIAADILNVAGEWKRWLRITFSPTKIYYSTPISWIISEQGT